MPGDDIKLNLGCAAVILPGYVNVDSRPGEGVDLVCDIRKLPYEKGTITQILLIHVIEHLTFDDAVDLIRKCFDLLKPGGQLLVEAPDVFKAVRNTPTGEWDAIQGIFGDLKELRAGHGSYQHLWGWTGSLMEHQLATTGFNVERGVEDGIGHGRPWRDFRVIGFKPNGVKK